MTGNMLKQSELLESISEVCVSTDVDFTWAYDTSGTVYTR